MSDTDIKVLLVLVGIVGALVSAITSCLVFFWIDGRRRYQSHLSGLRTLLMVIESISANVKMNSLQRVELKLDWFIAHADVLLRSEATFLLVCDLILQVATVQSAAFQLRPDIAPVLTVLARLRQDAVRLLHDHGGNLRRFLYLTSRNN